MSDFSCRVAVVGVGALGQHHARIYAEMPEVELVAVVDANPQRAQEVARRFQCQALADFSQIFDRVDAVSLAVPTVSHAAIGRELLRRGIHVLVEKPIAHDLAAADQLIMAQQQSGAVLQVGHSERFNPALAALGGLITRPLFFEAHRLGLFVPRSLEVDVVLDLMIHDLDLVIHLMQEPIREVRAVGIPVLTPRVDMANARLEFENGCVANLTASRVSVEKTRKFRFFQPHDYVSIDLDKQDVQMFSLVEAGSSRQIEKRRFDIRREEPLKGELQAFVAAIAKRKTPHPFAPCSGEEGKEALRVALLLLEQISASIPTETG